MTPIFSLLHPSARPHKWREIYEAWIGAADQAQFIEYVLCVDERWGFPKNGEVKELMRQEFGIGLQPWWRENLEIVWNTRRRCYVDAVNTAAEASTGRILIVIADDQYPCDHWDTRLLNREPVTFELPNEFVISVSDEFVISVSTGTPHEHERGIMVMPILSRARYQRKGYVFFPEYESAFADNDFYSEAAHDKCIIDARDLMFPHRHPLTKPGAWEKRADGAWINTDEAYAAQNRPEAYQLGEKIFSRRFGKGFGDNGQRRSGKETNQRSIALALPGEFFHHVYVVKLLELIPSLMREGWNYCPLLLYCSEPGITRATIAKGILELKEKGAFSPEYILWVDHDQIVEAGQVLMLINDLDQLPEADMMAGWTWIASSGPHANAPQVSCGRMDISKGELSHAEYTSVQSADGVFEVGWTGFPVVLMRTSALEKVGKHPFAHYPCPESPWGECGEDISFCKRLTDAGGKIFVDSRVFVPHMKLKALGPVPQSKAEISLALAGTTDDEVTHLVKTVEEVTHVGKGHMSTIAFAIQIPEKEKERIRIAEQERQKSFKLVVGDEMVKLNADSARYASEVFKDLI